MLSITAQPVSCLVCGCPCVASLSLGISSTYILFYLFNAGTFDRSVWRDKSTCINKGFGPSGRNKIYIHALRGQWFWFFRVFCLLIEHRPMIGLLGQLLANYLHGLFYSMFFSNWSKPELGCSFLCRSAQGRLYDLEQTLIMVVSLTRTYFSLIERSLYKVIFSTYFSLDVILLLYLDGEPSTF